jgi:hypothetical protein
MKKTLIVVGVGLGIFLVCLFLVSAIGDAVVKTAPGTRGQVNLGVIVISALLTMGALKEIFLRK